jgi:plasmid stabilization system protein ParE
MSPTLSIHELAETEINEAADFYDVENPGLGGIFLDEVQSALGGIVDFPDAAPLIRGRVRKRIMTKFPYSLVYAVRRDSITILAVAHHKRRPFYWRARR